MKRLYWSIRADIQENAEWLRANGNANFDFARIFAATDVLLEAGLAAEAYSNTIRPDSPGSGVLCAYGFLQALFNIQDAVNSLRCAVGLSLTNPEDYSAWARIRSLRNRATGHPSRADRKGSDGQGLTSAFFNLHEFSKDGFTVVVVLEKDCKSGHDNPTWVPHIVNVETFQKELSEEVQILLNEVYGEIHR